MLKELINNYKPYNEQEINDKEIMLKFIDDNDNYLIRDNKIGHFTASAWVINKDKTKVLMIYHNIYNSWAWTGGHADGEEELLQVALREVTEETGIKNIKPINQDIHSLEIIPVDGHIKKNKYVSSHLHFNITFLIEADELEPLTIKEDENSGVKWVDIKKAVSLSKEDRMKVIYQKIIDKI